MGVLSVARVPPLKPGQLATLAPFYTQARKRVIKILRDLCLRNPGSPRAVEACCHLVGRVSDGEEEVQKLIIKTFQELWFAPPTDRERPSGLCDHAQI